MSLEEFHNVVVRGPEMKFLYLVCWVLLFKNSQIHSMSKGLTSSSKRHLTKELMQTRSNALAVYPYIAVLRFSHSALNCEKCDK